MSNAPNQPLRMALIGGGGAGFIGKVHATAATLDRQAELVAGALSSNPDKSKAAAAAFGIAPDRAYGSYQELLDAESKLPADRRVNFVSIATPNFTHCDIACAAMEAGFHAVCDKPMTTNLDDAQRMLDTVETTGRVFALTHNYSGYPLMRQAREMIANGELGEIIAVRATYVQGWMHGMDPQAEQARGAWKSDPLKNGRAGSLGDVGTHAFHLASFVTGLHPEALLSNMQSYSRHHELDDYGHSLVRFDQGATGMITWSQMTHGRQNDLSIEVDGTKAALTWRQEEPNQMFVRALGQPTKIYERDPNSSYASPDAIAACRLPGGHPEAFFEAFANVYRNAFEDMRRVDAGESFDRSKSLYPSVADGVAGVRFMTRCLDSAAADSAWQKW
ncbi:Gfo/Idh/MocA family protein [Fuerstiella marisgermanici]|uniref:Putative oxidoreductase YcjS n=1 Tax=Fuerstiella marisgermanici TaxID=1891926 RepID=A0A1P8WBF6_9PLAN|nr:Gfo/Idh/MocA family oxidoreductase [Fuerstiella marisgermanici]APZ91398.1 putative oxidoreductase YcjS [Fuerstiella marisgermanici]